MSTTPACQICAVILLPECIGMRELEFTVNIHN